MHDRRVLGTYANLCVPMAGGLPPLGLGGPAWRGKGGLGKGTRQTQETQDGWRGEGDMKLIIIHMLGLFANFHFNGQSLLVFLSFFC